MEYVDALGDVCPIPVVKAKKAIAALQGQGSVEVHVDNEIAVQNLVKMANQKGYGVSSEKLEDQHYVVYLHVGETTVEEETVCHLDARNDHIVVISSSCMGEGDEVLGKVLMKSFLYALTSQDILPSTIIFYNSGVFITTQESDMIEDLRLLENQGVEILSCGTCLNHYGLEDKLLVGGVSNMYTIVEKMSQASHVIKP